MKKLSARLSFLLFCAASFVYSSEIPFPDPGHEGLGVTHAGRIGDFNAGVWVQYRIMYNNANLPGPGGTTSISTKSYDFFRQRFRLGIDLRSDENAGGYAQFEYRGGWGGSSPFASDPRSAAPVNNPFNRLEARGLRYGFLYKKFEDTPFGETLNISAGILPLTDQVGRLLFDADWDFNVGGIVAGGSTNCSQYRAGYVRMIEGVGGTREQIDKDGNLIIADYTYDITEKVSAGAHVYNFYAPRALGVTAYKSETWFGFTMSEKIHAFNLSESLIINKGKAAMQSHSGFAVRIACDFPVQVVKIGLLGIFATGDDTGRVDKRFVSLHELVGTNGFWGYTHIFTPNGPSDVNDLGLTAGNNGAGLLTVQVQADIPLIKDTVDARLSGGLFRAQKERNNSKNMGAELGGMIAINVSSHLTLEIGSAVASMGDFYGSGADTLHEFFSRFQLVF